MSLPHDNFNIQWSGFSDSLPIFVEETLKRIKGLNMGEQRDFFDQCKEKLMQEWFNSYLEQTYK
jgi:secreted Zn-dependent insulinase-like peptidase